MRDLNLGPDSRKLVDRFKEIDGPFVQDKKDWQAKAELAADMAKMLERWMEVAWCWVDAAPARICGGPHVKVRYTNSKLVEVIEPIDKVGETFPDVPYTIIK